MGVTSGRVDLSMNGTKARVLVVDDAQVMRRACEKMLQADYDIVLANDGEAGWETLSNRRDFDMLITDIQMPRLDGYGLICRVRADNDPRIRDLPIITITGAEDDETRIRAYACGSTDFITKPFDKKLLQSRVHAYLRLKQASLLHAENIASGGDRVGNRDPITRLNGLGSFVQSGKELFQQAQSGNQDLSVTALDIDDFAVLRRQHGETFANMVLLHVAKILSAMVRREEVVARVGDAEFAVLIPNGTREQALVQCERLRERIASEPFTAPSGPVAVTASFGLVTLSEDAPETFEKLLVLVEQRLSQARSDGGNRVGVTLLSDVMPEPEEVVLTAVAESDDSGSSPVVESTDEVVLVSDDGELSVTELEALARDEARRSKASTRRP